MDAGKTLYAADTGPFREGTDYRDLLFSAQDVRHEIIRTRENSLRQDISSCTNKKEGRGVVIPDLQMGT
jgi:hypothetical protein